MSQTKPKRESIKRLIKHMVKKNGGSKNNQMDSSPEYSSAKGITLGKGSVWVKDEPSLLIVGITGSGKTNIHNIIFSQLLDNPDKWEYYGVKYEYAYSELDALAKHSSVVKTLVRDKEEVESMATELLEEHKTRKNLLEAGEEGSELPDEMKSMLLFVEDIESEGLGEKAFELLKAIASSGDKTRIFFVLQANPSSIKHVPKDLMPLISAKIMTSSCDPITRDMLGVTNKQNENLNIGRNLYITSNGNRHFSAPRVSNQDIKDKQDKQEGR